MWVGHLNKRGSHHTHECERYLRHLDGLAVICRGVLRVSEFVQTGNTEIGRTGRGRATMTFPGETPEESKLALAGPLQVRSPANRPSLRRRWDA